jgi:hypothetical protein
MWKRRSQVTAAIAMALGAAALGVSAQAATDPAKIDYRDSFTTQQPGAPTGRLFKVEFTNPDDPHAKPPPVQHVHTQLPAGGHFDTGAIPRCTATDAQLMAQGPDGCPAASRVGTNVLYSDWGPPTPDSDRFVRIDTTLFNEKDGVILVNRDSASGAYVVVHGKLSHDALDLELPPLPGSPPDGGADKREDLVIYAASSRVGGRTRAWITTPPTCPANGSWVLRTTYTFRNGRQQTASSPTPCLQAPPSRPPLRLAFFHRQRAGAGEPIRVRVWSSRAAAATAAIARHGHRLAKRGFVLHTGVNSVRLPAMAAGSYRLTISAHAPGSRRASRSASLAVR